jgi:hypothetical protein
MIQIALHRSLSWVIACSDVRQWERGDTSHGWQDKSADCRRAIVVGGVEVRGHRVNWGAVAFHETLRKSTCAAPSHISTSLRVHDETA